METPWQNENHEKKKRQLSKPMRKHVSEHHKRINRGDDFK